MRPKPKTPTFQRGSEEFWVNEQGRDRADRLNMSILYYECTRDMLALPEGMLNNIVEDSWDWFYGFDTRLRGE